MRIARFKFAKIVRHSVFEILSSSISFLFHCFINIFSKSFWFLKNAATDRTHTIFDKARKTLYTPASSARFITYRMFVKPSFFLNLPGWRWGSITQNPLVAVSRPLHSGVCETRQDIGLPVLHSEISDSGLLRTRGDQQKITTRKTRRCPVLRFSKGVFVVVSYVFVFMPLRLYAFLSLC